MYPHVDLRRDSMHCLSFSTTVAVVSYIRVIDDSQGPIRFTRCLLYQDISGVSQKDLL